MSIQANFPAIKPTLLLDFANTKQLDPRITFTRASTATYYGTETAKAEENLLLQSQDFTTTWVNVNSTDAANTATAPDGTTTADTLTDDVTSGTHSVYQSVSVLANTTYVVSCFMKAGTNNFGLLSFTDAGTSQRYFAADFNLSTGAVRTSVAGSSGAITSANITSVGGGWYRCVIIGQASAVSTSNRIYVGVSDGASALGSFGIGSYVGTGTTIEIWGAQLEQRSAVTAYTATTTQPITNYIPKLQTAASGVARFDHNPTTGESLGLLIEESRTNLLTYSEQFDDAAWTKTNATITANTIVAPDGTLIGDKLVEDTANTAHNINRNQGVTIGASYAFTVYAKAAERSFFRLQSFNATGDAENAVFNLATGTIFSQSGTSASTITPVGNGWYRCSVIVINDTDTNSTLSIQLFSDGTTSSYTGDGFSGIYIWGAQLEEGAFATSYIPTVASQVTRAADAASMTGTNFSSWYRADEGTFYAEFAPASSNFGSNKNIFLASDGTVNNFNGLRYTSSGSQPANSATVAGISQSNILSGTMVAGTWYKMAGAYKVNDFAMSRDARTVGTDTSGTLPVVTQAEIGALAGTNISSQMIKKLAYYPLRVTNAQLQGLTS